MAELKPLGTIKFKDVGAQYEVWLGSNTYDNVVTPAGVSSPYDSKDYPLGRPGGQVWSLGPGGLSNLAQTYLYKELVINNGYGPYVALLKDTSEIGVKLYLNGLAFDGDGNPQPYVVFENDPGTGKAILNYYRADGTFVHSVFTHTTGYSGYPRANILCGKTLYEDGVFGYNQGSYDIVWLQPHYNLGIPSSWRYEWSLHNHYDAPFSPFHFIDENVMDDLWEYLPHEPEGYAEDDSQGDFDGSSDDIAVPGVPTISPLSTNIVKLYQMSNTQMQNLASLLWDMTPGSFNDTILKLLQDPYDALLNLSICPITFDNTNLTTQNLVIGNYVFNTVTGQRVGQPYKRINFGTLYINEFWGNYADYSPNTKLSIYLPYVGLQPLKIEDVMNGGVALYGIVDAFTGIVQYFLYSSQSNHRGRGHSSVLYTWSGNVKYDIPISSSNYAQGMIKYLSGVTDSIASFSMEQPLMSTAKTFDSLVPNQQMHIKRGGVASGNAGFLGIQYPYLILERPELTMTELYNHTIGTPNENTDYLSNYSGYVKVKGVHMEISGATSDELNQIESILKAGVII